MAGSTRCWALALAVSAMGCEPAASDDAAAPMERVATGSVDVSEVRQAIERLDAQWEDAANRGDAAAVASLYAEDGRFMVPNADIVEGRANIQAAVQGLVDMKLRNVDLTTVDVGASGDLAYEVGRYSLEVQPPGAPQHVTDKGKYVLVLKRQTDGTWKIVADIFNTNQPAPPAKP